MKKKKTTTTNTENYKIHFFLFSLHLTQTYSSLTYPTLTWLLGHSLIWGRAASIKIQSDLQLHQKVLGSNEKCTMSQLALPSLPAARKRPMISPEYLTRKKLQALLHAITQDLKARGTKTPHVFLPFRSRVDDTRLETFLDTLFPEGKAAEFDAANLKLVLKQFDEFTLVCALKYLWCRLPNNEIVGWNVYLEFKRREQDAGYPKDAFLSIMPKCLSSSSHASIVYDFLDLLISVAANSQYNHLSGRKIAKMAAMWAFNPTNDSPFYDATTTHERSFLEGLASWERTCNGVFHLLLAFLRAMLPDTEAEALNLPKTLQSLLVTNTYPPPEKVAPMKSVITIPCVQIRLTRRSADPYELISKVRHNLRYDRKDDFLLIENYTILKNIFQKDSTNDIVATLTEESRRVLARISADPIRSNYGLYPGWVTLQNDPDVPMYSEVTVSNVSLQDYYIWTWLSLLASDQCDSVKAMFGRSIVVEAGLRGFQKWLLVSEVTITPDEYISTVGGHTRSPQRYERSPVPYNKYLEKSPRNGLSHERSQSKTSVKYEKSLPLPPANPPLPDVSFKDDQFSVDGLSERSVSSYLRFMTGLGDDLPTEMSKLQVEKPKTVHRPRPPPLEAKERLKLPVKARRGRPDDQTQGNTFGNQAYGGQGYENQGYESQGYNQPYQANGTEKYVNEAPRGNPSHTGQIFAEQIPERGQAYPEYQTYQAYADKDPQVYEQPGFSEPYETYQTLYDAPSQKPSEPFDNYPVPGEKKRKNRHQQPQEPYPGYIPDQSASIDAQKGRPKVEASSSRAYGEDAADYGQQYQQREYQKENPKEHQQQEYQQKDYQQKEYQQQEYQKKDRHRDYKNHKDYSRKEQAQEPPQSQSVQAQYPSNDYVQGYQQEVNPPKAEYTPKEGHNAQGYGDSYTHRMDELPPLPVAAEEKKTKKKKKRRPKEPYPMDDLPDGPPPPLPPMVEQSGVNMQAMDSSRHTGNGGQYPYGENVQESNVYVEPVAPVVGRQTPGMHPQPNELTYLAPPERSAKGEISRGSSPHSETSDTTNQTYQLLPYHQTPDNQSPAQSQYFTPVGQPQNLPVTSPSPAPGAQQILATQPLVAPSEYMVPAQLPSPTPQQRGRPQPTGHPSSQPQQRQQPPQQPPQQMQQMKQMPQNMQLQMPPQMGQQVPPMHQHVPQPMPQPMPQQMPPAQAAHPASAPQQMPPMPYQQPYNPQGPSGAVPQQYYYPPPQGYFPPAGYGYPPQPMYYPPPKGYYPPPQSHKPKPTTSELTMMGMPPSNKFNKNGKVNKANMRAALQGSEFGI